MSHTEHLLGLTQVVEFGGDRLGDFARYTRIDFIKDQGTGTFLMGKASFECQQLLPLAAK